MRHIVVNALTLSGLILGAVGIVLLPDPAAAAFLIASLGIDALDGWLARRLRACTEFGAWFDWCTDTALAYAMVFRMLEGSPMTAVFMMSAVVVFQSVARATNHRWSGRAMVTAIPIASILIGYTA